MRTLIGWLAALVAVAAVATHAGEAVAKWIG
jgi:hypothetical protein